MEKDHDQKHACKFCNKIFPCGRSLGGHMRSHLINVSSSDHRRIDGKLPKKKLPPLVNGKSSGETDFSVKIGGKFCYGLREDPIKKTNKSSKSSEEDTLLQGKTCKECGKSFHSWKALFGHMKCHSVNARSSEEDSWNGSNDQRKPVVDSQSDNEAATPFYRRKRSDRIKRYTSTTNSSSLSIANHSASVSEIDQQEQEEVALSLIILSMDKGDWSRVTNSVLESSNNSAKVLEAEKVAKTTNNNSKKLRNGLKTTGESDVSADEFCVDNILQKNNVDVGCNESEVNSPRNLIKESGLGQFEIDCTKTKSRKRKCTDIHDFDSELCQNFERKSRFSCSICKKAFASYQALGGHRASHKKFNGCCAPRSETSMETESSHNQSDNHSKLIKSESPIGNFADIGSKKNKEHECPICFKVFPSGQALGGHKRSHLTGDQVKTSRCNANQQPIREVRDFLDLNMPAPAEEECNDLKPWWLGTSHKHEPFLGLLSSYGPAC